MGKCWTELPFQHTGHYFCPSSSSLLSGGCVRSYLIIPKMLQEFDVESRNHQPDPCNQRTRQLLIPLWTSSPAKDHHTGPGIFRFISVREPDHKGWLLRDRWTARKDPFAEMILDQRESGRQLWMLRSPFGRHPAMNVFPLLAIAGWHWKSLAVVRPWVRCSSSSSKRPCRANWFRRISWMDQATPMGSCGGEFVKPIVIGGTDHEDVDSVRWSVNCWSTCVNLKPASVVWLSTSIIRLNRLYKDYATGMISIVYQVNAYRVYIMVSAILTSIVPPVMISSVMVSTIVVRVTQTMMRYRVGQCQQNSFQG